MSDALAKTQAFMGLFHEEATASLRYLRSHLDSELSRRRPIEGPTPEVDQLQDAADYLSGILDAIQSTGKPGDDLGLGYIAEELDAAQTCLRMMDGALSTWKATA